MAGPEHQSAALAEAFVGLVDTLDGAGVDGVAARLAAACVDLVPAEAAGVVLAEEPDQLRVAAHVPNAEALDDLFGSDAITAVARRACATGEPIDLPDLTEAASFPGFAATAGRYGFRAAHVLPMRLRTDTVGALTLLFTTPDVARKRGLYRAGALVAVATAGILTARATRADVLRTERLRTATDTRVVVEQAKGMIAAHNSGDLDAAFAVIRAFSRRNSIRIHDVARAIVDGRIPAGQVASLESG